jgi:hypothetical protein
MLERARLLAKDSDKALSEADRLEGLVGKDAGVEAAVQHAVAHERQMSIGMSNLGMLYVQLAREA